MDELKNNDLSQGPHGGVIQIKPQNLKFKLRVGEQWPVWELYTVYN